VSEPGDDETKHDSDCDEERDISKEQRVDLQDESMAEDTRRKLQRHVDFPAYSTLYRARWDSSFDDVKRREKHFHVRCEDCSKLVSLLHNVKDIEQRDKYNQLLKEHTLEVKSWRQKETVLHNQSKSRPEEFIVLSFDDTEAMGFPRTTNRGVHNIPTDKVNMVPFNLKIMEQEKIFTCIVSLASGRRVKIVFVQCYIMLSGELKKNMTTMFTK